MDWLSDLLNIALTFDYIKRINNVTYELINLETNEIYKDDTGKDLRGKKSFLVDYILTHNDFREQYINMLQNHISAENTRTVSLLDQETVKEIAEEANTLKDND